MPTDLWDCTWLQPPHALAALQSHGPTAVCVALPLGPKEP